MSRRISLSIVTSLLLLVAGCATPANDSVTHARADNASTPVGATRESTDFLVDMVDARRMDAAEGALAATRATTPELRAYGEEMVGDQRQLLTELNALAVSLQVTVPSTIGKDKSGPLRDLGNQQGRDFDRQFMSMIRIDHERDVKAFTQAAEFTQDPTVMAFARRRLALVQLHLDQVKTLQKAD